MVNTKFKKGVSFGENLISVAVYGAIAIVALIALAMLTGFMGDLYELVKYLIG